MRRDVKPVIADRFGKDLALPPVLRDYATGDTILGLGFRPGFVVVNGEGAVGKGACGGNYKQF